MNLLSIDPAWATTREARTREELQDYLDESNEDILQIISDELQRPFYTLQCSLRETRNYYTLPFSKQHDADNNDTIELSADTTAATTSSSTIQYTNRISYVIVSSVHNK